MTKVKYTLTGEQYRGIVANRFPRYSFNINLFLFRCPRYHVFVRSLALTVVVLISLPMEHPLRHAARVASTKLHQISTTERGKMLHFSLWQRIAITGVFVVLTTMLLCLVSY